MQRCGTVNKKFKNFSLATQKQKSQIFLYFCHKIEISKCFYSPPKKTLKKLCFMDRPRPPTDLEQSIKKFNKVFIITKETEIFIFFSISKIFEI